MRSGLVGVGTPVVRALRPVAAPLAVGGAVRTFLVAATILLVGAVFGDLEAVGSAFLGAACAVAFVQQPTYRQVSAALIGQACGACVGLGVAALTPGTAGALVTTAVVVAAMSGVVGSLTPAAPGFGMMMSIGLAVGQFGHSTLPWWAQCSWYLVGSAAIGALWLWRWPFRSQQSERDLAASVFDSAADLCEAVGSSHADDARARLAAASAAARSGHRTTRAELAAFAAAALYAEGTAVPAPAVSALRTAAERTRFGLSAGVEHDVAATTPGLAALVDALSDAPTRVPGPAVPSLLERAAWALRTLRSPEALDSGARLGVCMGAATAATVALHGGSHSFWLPLTVAVVIRPEYASIFVRTVNRVCGTVAGAAVAALVLVGGLGGIAVALMAACALAFAVLMAPKLYAFNVIGVTAAALSAASIGTVDAVLPLLRLLDTTLGALIAVVLGYLLWPRARRFTGRERLHQAADAAAVYLDAAIDGSTPALSIPRDDAYRLAHLARQSAERALAEPPPVNRVALQHLPYAIELEHLVDDITRVVAAADSGNPDEADARRIDERLQLLRRL